MNGTSFRGRGCMSRGRKPRGVVTGIGGSRIPQPNFIQPNRDSHVHTGDFWLEHSSPPPWQQINGPPPPQPHLYSNFESQRYRGRPQFCPGLGIRGNGKKIRGESRPRPGILPTPGFRGLGISRPPQSEQLRFPPPLGSEEERQQKIAETADKIKQKLSMIGIGNAVNFWEDDVRDVSFSQTEEMSVANKAIPELKHDPPELDLTVNDFKDIGRVDPDTTASLYDSVGVLSQKNKKSEAEKVKENPKLNAWDDTRLKNARANVNEPSNIAEKFPVSYRLAQSIECSQGTVPTSRGGPKESAAEPTNDELDQMTLKGPNYSAIDDRKSSMSKLSSELTSSQMEKDKTESKKIAGNISDSKPEFNKVREKLREVIKVERQNEKEGTAGPSPDNRTTLFQHATGPRLQPPVRLDFHPGIRPRIPRFQGSPHFHPPFRPEHGMEMRPSFRPDFSPRFNHGPKNFNISPRLQSPQMIPPEFNARALPMVGPRPMVDHGELNMQLNFDPREPPPRFNGPVFNPNDRPPKFCPPSGLNGFQLPSGFYQNGPPPRFVNQDEKSGGLPPPFVPNLNTSSPVADFSQLVPPNYNQIPPMHCSNFAPPINGSFNPAMPPPNPASCIIPKFPPPSMPSSASSSACSSPFATDAQSMMQLPPMPMNALEIQPPPPPPPHPPTIRPPPPASRHLDNISKTTNERDFSQRNDAATPYMKDELEEMQEALEFAKQFMNMSNDETEGDATNFNMLMFPDLAPIPSTQPSSIEQESSACEFGNVANKRIEVCKLRADRQVEKSNPRIVSIKMITNEEFLMGEQEDKQLSLNNRIRPKVVFNVNSRSKKFTQLNEWQNQNNKDFVRHGKSSEKLLENSAQIAKEGANKHSLPKEGCDANSPEKRNNRKDSQLQRDENKEHETKTSQGSSGFPISIIDSNTSHKDIANDAIDQSRKFQGSCLKLSNKSLLASTVDANWKDKVINQFLKMSKNDICNMVNSSGLRKFDIAMKHLVKERKYSLSQERRSSADDAIKEYDMSREEFMSQLSAMLDPSATVDIKNLPSKFIQHLSEVLKLDVESHLSDSIEPWPTPTHLVADNMDVNYNNGNYNDQNNFSENNNRQNFDELLETDSFSVPIESDVQPIQTIQRSADFSNLCADKQIDGNPIATHDNDETLPSMTAIGDIFSAGIARAKLTHESVTPTVATTLPEQERNTDRINGQFFPHDIIRVRGLPTMQIPGENLDRNDRLSARSEDAIAVEKTGDSFEDKSQEKYESIERWNRRKRQDPDMFRNLTKEEWEAKYSRSADSLSERELVLSTSPRSTNSSRSMGFREQQRSRNHSPPLSLKETNWNTVYAPERSDEIHKWSRLKDHNPVTDSETDKSSNCTSRSSDSDGSALSDVTKLLKVIKSREKIAKNISDSEKIRDEVSAEIVLAKRRDRERRRQCKMREDDSDTRSKESRDKQKWNNDSGLENNETGKEVSDKKEMEREKNEMVKNINNVRLPKRNFDLLGIDELDKMNFQEQQRERIEFPVDPKRFTNDQEMLLTQDHITSPKSQEPADKILSDEVLTSINDKVCEVFADEKELEDPESPTPTQNHSKNLELQETKNTCDHRAERQSRKSGTKKIDIQAYKARKLQRNEMQDDKIDEIETDSNLPDSDAGLPIGSEDATLRSKTECKQKNVSKNHTSTELIKEKNDSAQELNSVRKDEEGKSRNEIKLAKHQHNEKSKEESHREEKFDKKRSRNYSRDRHRPRSREDNCKTSKDKSQRSFRETSRYSKSEKGPRSKSPRDKNYRSESKDKKPAKHRTSDTPKEVHERTDERDKNRKTIAEDKPGHKRASLERYDAKKKGHRSESDPTRNTLDTISIDTKSAKDLQQKSDIVNNETPENLKPVIDSSNAARESEEMPTDVPETSINLETSQVSMIDERTESSLRNLRILKNDLPSSPTVVNSDFAKSRDAEDFNEEEITRMDSESINPKNTFDSTNLQEDANQLFTENKDHSDQIDTKDCSASEKKTLESDKVHEEKSTDNSDLAHTKAESLSCEISEKVEIPSNFNDYELQPNSQCGDNGVKLIVENKIHKVISQLDLLNEENKGGDDILSGNDAEITISSSAASKFRAKEPSENATLDLNSPGTPESPLKGFSEETIKTSILGKRKLVQSVLRITQDSIENKDSKDFDNAVLKSIMESDIVDKNSGELTSYSELGEIDGLSATDRRLENFHVKTETNLEDDENRSTKSKCNEIISDREIESIKKDNEENPGTTATYEEYEICARSVTPSGDTLSLGSSIDFENDEFIVLSEISSDENFSQDEERKRGATSIPGTKNLEKAEKRAILNNVSQKSDDIVPLTSVQSTKSEANRFSSSIASEVIEKNVRNLVEFCEVEVSSRSSRSELESNQSKNQNALSAAETSTTCLPQECKEHFQETDNISENIVNDGRVSPHHVSIQSDNPVIKKVNVGKIFLLETEAHCDKTKKDENIVKHVELQRTKKLDVLSKSKPSSVESNAKNNMCRVEQAHRKRTKKKEKLKLDEKKMKEILKDKDMVTVVEKVRTREGAMARIAKIDMEIQKLIYEKMTINQMLKCGELPTEKSPTDGENDLSTLKSDKEPDCLPPNNENIGTSANLTKVDSKTKLVSSHKKSSKNITSNTSADDIGNRSNGKEKEKKKKKTNKHDRSSSQDNSLPETEYGSVPSHKTLPRRSADMKNSVAKKEKIKKDSSGQSSRHQEEGSLNSTLQHEKLTSRIDKEITLAKTINQATLNKSVTESCQKSTKIDNHGRSQKKVNKISDSRDDTIRHSTKDEQHCEANDKIKSLSKTGCVLSDDPTEKQPPDICLDESNRDSRFLEQKGGKKTSGSLALLEDSYKQEKAGSRKRQKAVFCRSRKGALKCSSESNSRALSPTEEEMPLQLLYIRKFHQKVEPPESAESLSESSKLKRTRSAEVLDHVMDVINAVAQNKTGHYRRSNKIKGQSEGSVNTESDKVERKEKILKKLKRQPTHLTNRSTTTCEAKDVWSVTDLPNGESRSSYGISLDGNDDRNNIAEFDDLNGDKRGVGFSGRKSSASIYDSNNRSLPGKIAETSKGREDEAAYSRPKAKALGTKEDVDRVSTFEDLYEEDMSEMFRDESGKYSLSEQWNIADDETFDYKDDIPEFLNSDSDIIPQDSISHSNSTSCNLNMERGPDIFDLMLETAASDFAKTSKTLLTSGVRKRKSKRMISRDRESEKDLSVKKRIKMTRSEMMNCSVRLVDCKYTHLKNYQNSCAHEKSNTSTVVYISDKSNESSTHSRKYNGTYPSQIKTTIESYAHTAKSKGHFSPELTSNEEPNAATECPDWSFGKPQLTKDDKVVPSSSTELLTSRSDLRLNIIEGYSEPFDNDIAIIESQTASGLQSVRKAESFPAKLTKAGSSRCFDQMQVTSSIVTAKPPSDFSSLSQSQRCNEEVTLISDTQGKTSTKCEVNTSGARKQLTECKLRAKSLSKLVDLEVHHREANARRIESIKERVKASEKNAIDEARVEEHTSEERISDVEIINQIERREDTDIQEVEPPRIQYSVHKGPILDLKVFGDSILAASEDGVIYRYSQTCNGILNTYEGHKSAVTCMYVLEVDSTGSTKDCLFSGSLDGSLRCYDIKTSMQVRTATDVGSSIQCMDQSWGVIFLGTKSGYVSRFHIKTNVFKDDEIKFSEEAVLGLKATTEGPRRVLIVASRNQPITIRDAQNGLLIRTISGHKSHTVYSLLMDSNLVYCGTSGTAIPVFDFINGLEIKLYNAGPGIVCMRMYKQLLFAGCYDGNIYVFDTKEQKIVCSIPGPGNMLLSMDIVDNKIVAGSKDRRLHMWQMPEQVHRLLAVRT